MIRKVKMKIKLQNVLLSTVIIAMSSAAYSEDKPESFNPQMLMRENSLQDFNIVFLPIKPIEVDYSWINNINEIHIIDKSAYKYISSDSSEASPNYQSYIKDYPCLQQNTNTCSPHEKSQAYEKYKVDNFINGIIGQSQHNKKPLDKVSAFDWIEEYMNKSGDEYEPKILSAIEDENIKGNALLKEIASHCSEQTPSEDVGEYMKCLLKDTKQNSNVFLNIKTKCLLEASKTAKEDVDFMSNLQSCTNKEMLSPSMLDWIAFQSYRLGAIYYEQNSKKNSR